MNLLGGIILSPIGLESKLEPDEHSHQTSNMKIIVFDDDPMVDIKREFHEIHEKSP